MLDAEAGAAAGAVGARAVPIECARVLLTVLAVLLHVSASYVWGEWRGASWPVDPLTRSPVVLVNAHRATSFFGAVACSASAAVPGVAGWLGATLFRRDLEAASAAAPASVRAVLRSLAHACAVLACGAAAVAAAVHMIADAPAAMSSLRSMPMQHLWLLAYSYLATSMCRGALMLVSLRRNGGSGSGVRAAAMMRVAVPIAVLGAALVAAWLGGSAGVAAGADAAVGAADEEGARTSPGTLALLAGAIALVAVSMAAPLVAPASASPHSAVAELAGCVPARTHVDDPPDTSEERAADGGAWHRARRRALAAVLVCGAAGLALDSLALWVPLGVAGAAAVPRAHATLVRLLGVEVGAPVPLGVYVAFGLANALVVSLAAAAAASALAHAGVGPRTRTLLGYGTFAYSLIVPMAVPRIVVHSGWTGAGTWFAALSKAYGAFVLWPLALTMVFLARPVLRRVWLFAVGAPEDAPSWSRARAALHEVLRGAASTWCVAVYPAAALLLANCGVFPMTSVMGFAARLSRMDGLALSLADLLLVVLAHAVFACATLALGGVLVACARYLARSASRALGRGTRS